MPGDAVTIPSKPWCFSLLCLFPMPDLLLNKAMIPKHAKISKLKLNRYLGVS